MTFDAATGKSVMYGGYAGPFPIRDTWEWDSGPGIWTERKVSPPGVFDMAGAAYDSTRGRMLLFGGESFPTAGASRELWEWNGRLTSWTNLTPTPIPANWPSARIAPSAAYDPARRRLVVHGGDMPADRTWEWDPEGGAWFNRSVTPSPGVWPGPAFAWDERRGRGVLLIGVPVVDGGADGNFVPELWEWDGAAGQWSRRERQGGAPWPRARSSARMVFDPTVGRVLLFGGIVRQGLPLDDLWEWDGAEGRWTALEASAPSARPPARFVAGMAYDTACSRLVVFGGASLLNSTTGGPDLRDVWEWSRP